MRRKKSKVTKSDAVAQNFLGNHIHYGVWCLHCGKTLVSYYRHDYKTCGCPNQTTVDGGQIDYFRYGGRDMNLVRQIEVKPMIFTKRGVLSKKPVKTYKQFVLSLNERSR